MVHPVIQRVNEDLSSLKDFILTLYMSRSSQNADIFRNDLYSLMPLIFKSCMFNNVDEFYLDIFNGE